VLHDAEVINRTAHRIRGAATLARPGWVWAAAMVMNAPAVGAAALLGWFAFTADAPALMAVAGILFALVAFWALLVIQDSWRVLRRFMRRFGPAGGSGA
jgi:membrane protein YdbS with pleckstrin-like domain